MIDYEYTDYSSFDSSVVRDARYNVDTGDLAIRLHNGKWYGYRNVPRSEWIGLTTPGVSAGAWYNAIKNTGYERFEPGYGIFVHAKSKAPSSPRPFDTTSVEDFEVEEKSVKGGSNPKKAYVYSISVLIYADDFEEASIKAGDGEYDEEISSSLTLWRDKWV